MTNGLEVSLHAGQRMRQRGIRSSGISLVLDCGTQIDAQCFLLMEKDAAREADPGAPAHGSVFALSPGMPAEVHLRTGDRSPLSYLFKPLTDYFSRALR